MSLYAYNESKRITGSFDALIMAAMRKADSENARILQTAFPSLWDELQERYNAPNGLLPDEAKRRASYDAFGI